MRATQWLFATLKEVPSEAEIISHKLMLRAGLIKKLGAGLYSWLPTGIKVLKKVENIIREEMNKIGALEVLMPAIQPAELWQESGRWETFGGQLLTLADHQKREYCFGPTHEEVVTDIARTTLHGINSYPVTLYQIQTKFRDEIRPRFGVMRAREFLMKDAYSFHLSEESQQKTYKDMYNAYSQIFTRLGLKFRAVEADTGAIGGAISHEFQVLAHSGEDLIFCSTESDYAANIEKASAKVPPKAKPNANNKITKVATPNAKTIDSVCKLLKTSADQSIKALLVKGKKHPIVSIFLRGDDELNLIKAQKHHLIADPLTFVAEDTIRNELHLEPGYIGHLGLKIPIIVDTFAAAMPDFVCGANEIDKHYINASWNDAPYEETADLRNVKEGDASPDGHGILKSYRGIEVGHIFQLGDKYSKLLKLSVMNTEGELQYPIMGCYGIGVSRIVAAAIEQNHDDKGICWPEAMAPFNVVIIPIDAERNAEVNTLAEKLYQDYLKNNIDVLLDDRNERPGIKFADADLLGIPLRIVISAKHLANGEEKIEYKLRNAKDAKVIKITELPLLHLNV